MFLGVGKSAIIKAMSMHAEKILRKVGAKEDHPRVLRCAFTGKAASLIGQKLKKYLTILAKVKYILSFQME